MKTSRIFISTLASILVLLAPLSALSDKSPQPTDNIEHNKLDKTKNVDIKKAKFERDFANQCVEREIKNSINKDNDRKRFEKPCLCIAQRMMKDLTAMEAEKFLVEQKSTQSLRIVFDEAAYFCLQNKKEPTAPNLFGRK